MATRKKSATSAVKALEKRVGVEKLASRLDVTPKTVKKWLRVGVPEKKKTAVQAAWQRSERSRVSATRVWAERKISEDRDAIFRRHRLVDHAGGADYRRDTGRAHDARCAHSRRGSGMAGVREGRRGTRA